MQVEDISVQEEHNKQVLSDTTGNLKMEHIEYMRID